MKDRYQKKSMGNRRNSGGGGFGGGGGRNFGGSGGYGGSGGGRNFGGGSRQDDGYREQPTLYRAVCDQCGESCEVPFRPTGNKPVLCRDCFRKDDGGSSSRFGSKRPERSNSFDKPSYKSTPRAGAGNEEVVKQLKTLNAKMQQMLDLLIDLTDVNEDELDEESAEYEEGTEEEVEEDEDDEVEEEEKDEEEGEEEE